MTNYSILDNGTIVTNLADSQNTIWMIEHGYEIRHIETYHAHGNDSFIHWDDTAISLEPDLYDGEDDRDF